MFVWILICMDVCAHVHMFVYSAIEPTLELSTGNPMNLNHPECPVSMFTIFRKLLLIKDMGFFLDSKNGPPSFIVVQS